jgi:hypothetical protein
MSQFQFLNVRLFHATNSSSTHSVIVAGSAKGPGAREGEFGWQHFLQTTKEEKLAYFAQTLFGELSSSTGEEVADAAVRGLFGKDLHDTEGYVDHDSVWGLPNLPRGFGGEQKPALLFYKELAETIASDPTAHIRGGNDNEEYPEGYEGEHSPKYNRLQEFMEEQYSLLARKQNGIWALYNKKTGTKIHVNLGSEKLLVDSYRPETPELVDLKITDYCPYDCSYCYQGSTKDGKHAPLKEIEEILNQLGYSEVFEVALGGGEPTMHPNFVDILKACERRGITPNFTTKSSAWLKDEKIVKAVQEYVGSFAFSVENDFQLSEFRKRMEAAGTLWGFYKTHTFQYILDAHPMKDFVAVLKALENSYGTPLTLLGYKSTGRGGKTPHRNAGWLSKVLGKKEKHPAIGIDTVIAQQYADELELAKIDQRLYYKEEGRFSMYIDAVEKKFGKSSFVEPEEMIAYKTCYDFCTTFKTWQEEARA